MWRRVASQSPEVAGGAKEAYIKAFTALGQMLRDGRSLSGHERNCCFLNTRDNRFATISAASGLDFADDGRAIGLSDWDHDGDVDVWLSNRTGPRLRFMRNDGEGGASFITVKLRGTRCNRDAVGARLELHLKPTADGQKDALKLVRTVHAGRGFMSQTSKRIHFGVGQRVVEKLVVRWPNGDVEQFNDIRAGNHYEITQGNGHAQVWTRPTAAAALALSSQEALAMSSQSRIVISGRLPIPAIEFKSVRSDANSAANRPTLVNLWSTTCSPCIKELTEFSRRQPELRQAGINVLALNVDELMDDPKSDLSHSKQILTDIGFPFAAAAIDAEDSGTLDLFHQAFLSLRRPLPIPSSFLTTTDGRVAVIYRGPLKSEQLIRDLDLLNDDPQSIRDHAVPFRGKWHGQPIDPDPKRHAMAFMRGGFLDQGAKYLETYLTAHLNKKGWGPRESWPSQQRLAELCDTLADFYRLQNQPKKVVGVYRIALKFDPEFVPSLMNLGKINIEQGKIRDGLRLLEQAHRLAPSDPIVASDLGIAYAMTGRSKLAERIFVELLKRDPGSHGTRLNLGRLYFQTRHFTEAATQLREYLKHDPHSAEALRSLCWILASSPNDNDRDVSLARKYLSGLLEQTQKETAESHDLRAAMHAEVGEFEDAKSEARRAIRLARQRGSASYVTEIQQRLQRYQNRKPYRLR